MIRGFLRAAVLASFAIGAATTGYASTWTGTLSGTQTWNTATNWDTNPTVPNAIDATASFPNSPTANMAAQVPAAGITVGSIDVTNNSANIFTLSATGGGTLTFDVSSGEASLIDNGTSSTTNNVTVSAAIALNDPLRLTVNDTAV